MNKCPSCGAELDAKETGKRSTGKIALLAGLALATVGVVAALVMGGNTADVELSGGDKTPETTAAFSEPEETVVATIPADGNPDDVTCKGSYSVSDEELLEELGTVVATAGSSSLTNEALQVQYWMQFYDFLDMYSSYASMLGLNVAQGLDTQISLEGSMTWQQYFLSNALSSWHSYEALCNQARAEGYEMDAEYREYLDGLAAALEESAQTAGFATAQEMIQADMGQGATLAGYLEFMEQYYLGQLYYTYAVEQIQITDEEVAAYFEEYEEDYAANGLDQETRFVDVRHILLTPQGGTTNADGTVSYSEEEWEACRLAAQEILDEYLAGEMTEEQFAQLAGEHSADTGSSSNGGLYTDVYVGQMVEPFEEWCFDESRTYGETGLVKTTYGYHIMFFVESKLAWYETAWADLVSERGDQIVLDAMDTYPMTVDYSKIMLGFVDFSSAS